MSFAFDMADQDAETIEPYALLAAPAIAEAARAVGLQRRPVLSDEQLRDERAQRRLARTLADRVPGWSALTEAMVARFEADGLVLVRGLLLDPDNQLLVGLLASLGRVTIDGNRGRLVYDLVPIERPPARPDFELYFHTGSYFQQRPHEALALHCVKPGGQGGGVSKLARLDEILATLQRRGRPAAIGILALETVLFSRPRLRGGGYVEAPILERQAGDAGRLQVRFERRRVLRGARSRPGGYAPELVEAIADFEAAANASGSHLEYRLQADELLIIDNRRVLHARGEVPGGSASGRHLKRAKAYRP